MEEIVQEITENLHHGCTKIDAIETYAGDKKKIPYTTLATIP